MTDHSDGASEARRAKYGHLPPSIHLEDIITSQETQTAGDPRGGRDTEHDFIIRHAGG